jgi:hypothetical protein
MYSGDLESTSSTSNTQNQANNAREGLTEIQHNTSQVIQSESILTSTSSLVYLSLCSVCVLLWTVISCL